MATTKKAGAARKAAASSASAGPRPGFTRKPPSAMIYTLGDSWFTYPTIFDQGAPINLIRALDDLPQPGGSRYFLNEQGEAGATSDDLTTDWYLTQLTNSLRDNYDFLLLSMGGNDFVGSHQVNGQRHTVFGDFLLDYNGQSTGRDTLDQAAVSVRMDQTLANFQKVFRLCEQGSKNGNIKIITHVYDYLVPTERGARVLNRWQILGPWMYDDLVRKGVPPRLRADVPKALLQQYRTRLMALADDLNTHTQTGVELLVADTQGTLTPGDASQWINEIHPKNTGYKLLVKKIDAILSPLRDGLARASWRKWPS
jgi:lysophospholipase L1-like esterase